MISNTQYIVLEFKDIVQQLICSLPLVPISPINSAESDGIYETQRLRN